MHVEIINKPFRLNVYGFRGTATDKDYGGTAFRLMDKMWQVVKSGNIKNKGLNIWVYEPGDSVFAGVELEDDPTTGTGLELKSIAIEKYAYYKNIGPYNLIKQAGLAMTNELKQKGFETTLPYIEIYGHWTEDATTLETELLMSLL